MAQLGYQYWEEIIKTSVNVSHNFKILPIKLKNNKWVLVPCKIRGKGHQWSNIGCSEVDATEISNPRSIAVARHYKEK